MGGQDLVAVCRKDGSGLADLGLVNALRLVERRRASASTRSNTSSGNDTITLAIPRI